MAPRCLIACLLGLSLPASAMDLKQAWDLLQYQGPVYRAAVHEKEAGAENRAIGMAGLLPQISASAYDNKVNGTQRQNGIDRDLDYDSKGANVRLRQPLFNKQKMAEYRQGEQRADYSVAVFDAKTQDAAVRLAEHGKPEGGEWNYDAENRKPWKGTPPPPAPWDVSHDHRKLWAEIQAAGVKTFGEPSAEHFPWPCDRAEALAQLDAFIANQPRLSWVRPQAGLIGLARLKGEGAEPFARRLLAAPYRTFLLPGTAYDEPAHIRLGVGGGAAVRLDEGLARLAACLAEGPV